MKTAFAPKHFLILLAVCLVFWEGKFRVFQKRGDLCFRLLEIKVYLITNYDSNHDTKYRLVIKNIEIAFSRGILEPKTQDQIEIL